MTIHSSHYRLLVDTGSAVSLISKQTFDVLNVPVDSGEVPADFRTASGSPMTVFGVVTLEFAIESRLFEHPFVIAELPDVQGILGVDFLDQNEAGIHFAKQSLEILGENIKLEKESSTICARIKVARRITIPPSSEVLVEGYIEGGKPQCSEALI